MNISGLFRKRDLAVVLLVAVTIYVSLFDSPSLTYSIEPAWFIDQQHSVEVEDGLDSRYGMDYKMVPPVITDLEGDGSQELVMITADLQLKVFSAEVPASMDESDIYHPEELLSDQIPLVGTVNEPTGIFPVALKTGYVDVYSETTARTQVIVVVLDDWTVICYDSLLNIKWQKPVAHNTFELRQLSAFFHIVDVSVYIAPLQLQENGSPGVVLVGASMGLRDGAKEAGVEGFMSVLDMIEHENRPDKSNTDHPDMHARSKLEHFSMFALDSSNGHVLWKHDGSEVKAEQYSKSLPQHAFKLDLSDLMTKAHHAPGINDWTLFRQSLIDELPHTWFGGEHSSIRIAHFMRRHIGNRAGQQIKKERGELHRHPQHSRDDHDGKLIQPIGNSAHRQHSEIHSGKGRNGKTSTSLHAMPLLKGEVHVPSLNDAATLPHNHAEHTRNPNVVVVHTARGVEVVALRTGVPITSLALAKNRVYADIDGDGVVDAISVLDTPDTVQRHQSEYQQHQYQFDDKHSLQHCMMVVMSGLPARSQLFNGSICQERPSLHDPLGYASTPSSESTQKTKIQPSLTTASARNSGKGKHKHTHPNFFYVPPLILHKLNPDTQKDSNVRDVIVAIHSGVVTSYSGTGNFNWQLRGGPMWSIDGAWTGSTKGGAAKTDNNDNTIVSNGDDSIDPNELPKLNAVPALIGIDVDAARAQELGSHNSVYSNILVTGESTMQLISREGDVLSEAGIPRPPIARPVVGDFDNDGVTDIVVVTKGAVLGYHVTVVQASPTVLAALVILTIIAIVVFLSNIHQTTTAGRRESDGGDNTGTMLSSQNINSSNTGNSWATSTSSSVGSHPINPLLTRRGPRSKSSSIFQLIRSTDEQHLD